MRGVEAYGRTRLRSTKSSNVSGILSVAILDSEGALTTTDAHAAINADTKGEDMPRKSKTFSKI